MSRISTNIEYIQKQPRGTKFYCPSTREYNLSRAQAKQLAHQGFDVIAEDDITLSV